MAGSGKEPRYEGVWPVMLTPFDDRGEIDWRSLERLVDWYLAAGVHGLFAVCQSSEMFFLSDAEAARLARFVVERADGRVPVVASGHTATARSQQADQVAAMAATGAAAVILISNRLAERGEDDARLLENLAWLVDGAGPEVRLGVYECPYPYKRLLGDEVVRWCAASGRFRFIKDTSCNLATIRRRLALVQGSPLHIANANTATLLESLQAGAHGYSGVMANFHPELYVWLWERWRGEPERAEQLARYLTTSAMVEYVDYPVCAKDFQRELGNFATVRCRGRESEGFYRDHFRSGVRQALQLGDQVRRALGI